VLRGWDGPWRWRDGCDAQVLTSSGSLITPTSHPDTVDENWAGRGHRGRSLRTGRHTHTHTPALIVMLYLNVLNKKKVLQKCDTYLIVQ